MSRQTAENSDPVGAPGGAEGQDVLFSVNLAVWIGLMALTAATVAAAYADLGFLHVAAALAIATFKAGLVIMYFMHLRYATRTLRVMVFTAFFLLALAIGLTFFDVAYR